MRPNGLSEIRRNFEAISKRKSGILLCHETAKNSLYGVGFYLKSKWENAIIEFRPFNKRIAVFAV